MRRRDIAALALAALYCAVFGVVIAAILSSHARGDAHSIGTPRVTIQRAGLYVEDGGYAPALRCDNNTARSVIVRAYRRDVVLPRYSEMEIRL